MVDQNFQRIAPFRAPRKSFFEAAMTTGISFSNPETSETGWMTLVGNFSEIHPKLNTPDLEVPVAMDGDLGDLLEYQQGAG